MPNSFVKLVWLACWFDSFAWFFDGVSLILCGFVSSVCWLVCLVGYTVN